MISWPFPEPHVPHHGVYISCLNMLLRWHSSAFWRPERFHTGTGMLSIGIVVYWDMEAKEKTERNNAGKLEPGYSAQFDAAAAASNRHEQEKSIRLTRLLSKGLPPWERVEGIKAFGKEKKKKKTKKESRRVKWPRVAGCCTLCQISRLWPWDNIPSLGFHLRLFFFFLTVMQSFLSYCPFRSLMRKKKEERL